ncbi:glycosyltransferase family 4 protein [Arsenophonus sp. aPb]|uniref:glycosyltransferase family 4 protein n=1 Tax=Arsenophonus sp. aPb TaxID=3041619 RepID=UPI00246891FE|nr:glycosyltransferase family 4 protein [Arsenophonus sp. aPb]WGL98421.1 glycosyltransferase family 4 protein [Arsenophonus sp. aPb]
MKSVSFIIPALRNAGPVIVVKGIIEFIIANHKNMVINVFYLDRIEPELSFGVNCYHIEDKKNISKLFNSDIVHSHCLRPDLYVFKNRSKIKGKCLSTLHTDIYKEYKNNYNSIYGFILEWVWVKLILSKHDNIICLTDCMRRKYDKKIKEAELITINNGRNIDKNIGLNRLELSKEEKEKISFFKKNYKTIGSVSVLYKRKGLAQVIESLEKLSDYCFVIIGSGPEEENLKKLADKKGVSDRCLFLGSKKDGKLFYSLFDIAIFPALSEGFGLSLIEALYYCSCVCSDIDTFNELFNVDEVSFFQLGNITSLENAIRYADKNRDEFIKKAYSKYLSHYTADIMGNHYYKLYLRLMDS